jgi:hypothetical protein
MGTETKKDDPDGCMKRSREKSKKIRVAVVELGQLVHEKPGDESWKNRSPTRHTCHLSLDSYVDTVKRYLNALTLASIAPKGILKGRGGQTRAEGTRSALAAIASSGFLRIDRNLFRCFARRQTGTWTHRNQCSDRTYPREIGSS